MVKDADRQAVRTSDCVLTKRVLARVSVGVILVSAIHFTAAVRRPDHDNSRDVEEAILILVLLVDGTHQGRRGREDLVDKDKDCLFRRELDAFADHVDKLPNGQIGGDEVFLLVNRRNVAPLHLFADDGDPVGVLFTDPLRLCPALLEWVFLSVELRGQYRIVLSLADCLLLADATPLTSLNDDRMMKDDVVAACCGLVACAPCCRGKLYGCGLVSVSWVSRR